MSWSNKNWQGGEGPWGKPSPQGNRPQGGSSGPEKPDFDDFLRKGHDTFKNMFGGDNKKTLLAITLGVLVIWLASGFYIVQPDEQGVVLRFGKFHRTSTPGPNYHIPYPMESVSTPKVTAINRVVVGVSSGRDGANNDEESLMFTGDENIVDMNFEVQWKIKNAEHFLFKVRNPELTVKSLAESAMREVVGQMPIASELSQSRVELEQKTKMLMQQILDSYTAGVEVVSVNIKELNPPKEVIEAFYDVQRAKADQERLRNEAEAYHNDIVPKARGAAEQMIQDAQAYKQQVVAGATGDAARFSSIYKEYAQAKDVTKKRMYLETIEHVMQGMDKVILDSKNGNTVFPYLQLAPAAGGLAKTQEGSK